MFDILDKTLKGVIPDKSKSETPTNIEMIYFLFWEKGISFNEFNNLPLPYIFNILKVNNYINKEQEKKMKK